MLFLARPRQALLHVATMRKCQGTKGAEHPGWINFCLFPLYILREGTFHENSKVCARHSFQSLHYYRLHTLRYSKGSIAIQQH